MLFRSLDVDLAFFTKKWGRSFGRKVGNSSKDVRRNCYNCDQPRHFSDKCPYEKREDKPKYDKEAKKKLLPNPVNKRSSADKAKRRERAFLGTEYTSEDEEEEEASVGVAGLALGEPGSLFTYDYTKDYATTSKKKSHKCLMAKGAKVNLESIPNPPIFNANSPIPSSKVDDDDEDVNARMIKLHRVMISLHGEARAQFDYLMDTISSKDDIIEEQIGRAHV